MAKKTDNPAPWKFTDDSQDLGLNNNAVANQEKLKPINWVVNESIFQEKSILWYIVLVCVALVFAGLVLLVTKDKITTGIILICALVFGYYAGKRPRQVEYRLDGANLTISEKSHSLGGFKSFFIVGGDRSTSFILIPQKRFSPALTVYAALKDTDKVSNFLSNELPLDKNREDSVDRFLRRINF